MDFEVGVETIGFARQQRLQFAARHLFFQLRQRRLGLAHDTLVVLGLAECDHLDVVVEIALDSRSSFKLPGASSKTVRNNVPNSAG